MPTPPDEKTEISENSGENAPPRAARFRRSPTSPRRRRGFWRKPGFLYAATWLSTTAVGTLFYGAGSIIGGLMFSVPLMTILTLHELGHYLQARRYKIPASAPFFIPFPLPPFGTMGAVIKMSGRIPNAKALFDVGVSGPLAGLAATLVFLFVGLARSTEVDASAFAGADALVFGEPLLFQWVAGLFFDRSDPTKTLAIHPTAAAAWVGLFLTSLNLAPLGQLDGGHVFYALLRRRAVYFSLALFGALVLYVAIFQRWNWVLMLALIAFFGIEHPPTADDSPPLGWTRTLIGWATLAFVVVGLTPNPVDVQEAAPIPEKTPQAAAVETLEPNETPDFSRKT